MNEENKLKLFEFLGCEASYHYAGEGANSGWQRGHDFEVKARKVMASAVEEDPDVEEEFINVSKRFLWSL